MIAFARRPPLNCDLRRLTWRFMGQYVCLWEFQARAGRQAEFERHLRRTNHPGRAPSAPAPTPPVRVADDPTVPEPIGTHRARRGRNLESRRSLDLVTRGAARRQAQVVRREGTRGLVARPTRTPPVPAIAQEAPPQQWFEHGLFRSCFDLLRGAGEPTRMDGTTAQRVAGEAHTTARATGSWRMIPHH